MKANNYILKILLLALMFIGVSDLSAQQSDAQQDLQQLIEAVKVKIQGGAQDAEGLADELAQFDALLLKYADNRSDDVAEILFMKAMLYVQLLKDPDTAIALMEKLQVEFPESEQAKKSDKVIQSIKDYAASLQIQRSLVEQGMFPAFAVNDLEGEPLSLDQYKGKVVLIDFWATWCGPCINELPNVLQAYTKYHKDGFDIIGISLDKDRNKLTQFIQKEKMPWRQYFDGQGWQNSLAKKYGVNSIPATYLLDGEGRIIGVDLRGSALEDAVASALAQ